MEQIIEDYVLTNDTVDLEKALFEHPQGSLGLGEDGSVLASAARKSRDPLLKAWPEYLAAAFAQIEQDEGSMDHYLRNRLGLTDELRAPTCGIICSSRSASRDHALTRPGNLPRKNRLHDRLGGMRAEPLAQLARADPGIPRNRTSTCGGPHPRCTG